MGNPKSSLKMRRIYQTGKSGFTKLTPGVSSVYTKSMLSIIYCSYYEIFAIINWDKKNRCILVVKFGPVSADLSAFCAFGQPISNVPV